MGQASTVQYRTVQCTVKYSKAKVRSPLQKKNSGGALSGRSLSLTGVLPAHDIIVVVPTTLSVRIGGGGGSFIPFYPFM